MTCANCGQPIDHGAEVVAWTGDDQPVPYHEHCVDAETAMAADLYDPADDYPHGDY